jgi:hypothetical protein
MLRMDASEWLTALVWQLGRMANGDARRMAKERVVAVHALRVRMKKLRSVLRLGEGCGEDLRVIEGLCRGISSGISGARDAEVMRRLHWKLFGEGPIWAGEPSEKGWSVAKVRREVGQLERVLAGVTFPGLNWERVRANHERCFLRVKKALRHCRHDNEPEVFHKLRKRLKLFYFQSLALAERQRAKKRIRRAKELGKHLGKEHDLAVLSVQLAGRQDSVDKCGVVEKKRLKMHANLRSEGARLLR